MKKIKQIMICITIIIFGVLLLSGCDELSTLQPGTSNIEYTLLEIEDRSYEYDDRTIIFKTIHISVPQIVSRPAPYEPFEWAYEPDELRILMENIILDFILEIDVNTVRVFAYFEDGDISRRHSPDASVTFAPQGAWQLARIVETGDYETFEFSWSW